MFSKERGDNLKYHEKNMVLIPLIQRRMKIFFVGFFQT